MDPYSACRTLNYLHFSHTALSSWSQCATVSDLEVKLGGSDVTYVDSTPCVSGCESQTITFTVTLAPVRDSETYESISVRAGETEVASYAFDASVTDGEITVDDQEGTFKVENPDGPEVKVTLELTLPVKFDLGDQDWVGRVNIDATTPVDSSPKHLDKYS